MLAGATYGLAAIPKKWLNTLERMVVAEVRQQVSDLLAIAARSAPVGGPEKLVPPA